MAGFAEGRREEVTVYRVRCMARGLLEEHENELLFTEEDYRELPESVGCADPECEAVVRIPRAPREETSHR